MHIAFKKITLHNFMSFGHAELEFNNDGFIRVSGINENPLDNAGSNGSGKSSLWESIVWVITGETIRGTKQVVNLNTEDGCFVDIEFNIDNKSYQLIRSKDHSVYKTSLQIFIDGQDVSGKGIRDSQQLLQQYLPELTSSLLGSVIILGQGLPQKFTNNTPSGRKEVLEKLSKSDFMIDDLKKRVAKRKVDLTNEQRSYEDQLLQLNTQKTVLTNQINTSKQTLLTLNFEVLDTRLHQQRESHKTLVSNIETLKSRTNILREELDKITKIQTQVTAEQNNELSVEKLNYDNICSPYIIQLNEFKAQLSIHDRELSRIKSIKDICPTCGQKITSVHKPDSSQLEADISELSEKIKLLNDSLYSYQQDYELKIKLIQDKYGTKNSQLLTESSELSTLLTRSEKELLEVENKQNEVNKIISDLEKQITQLQTSIDLHNNIILDNEAKIRVIQEKILYNIMQKDLTQSHLDVISKFDTALKRDFRGYLLSTVIHYIETRAKQYCKVIFDTSDINFCLNGNNIDISYMNKAYENLSGGEKQKIDLIIQFSIRDMLSSQLNFTSNILVLDEVFDGLDTVGCNRVIDLISNLSDVKNVFIVTHRKDLSISTDSEIVVVKSSAGITEIR